MSFAVSKPVAELLPHCSSWNLRLDKFSFDRSGAPKSDALRKVLHSFEKSASTMQRACAAKGRWLDALKVQSGPRFRSITLVNESRLLLHLGRASVLENVGLCAEPITGLPIIPGTALKGVLSTWACWAANESRLYDENPVFETHRSDLARRIFGDNSPDGSKHAGDVIFIGGFPIQPPVLGWDIVNPHHESDGREKTKLTPSAFLAVEAGTPWRIAFVARSGAPDTAALLEKTEEWLIACLTQLGIGAKTAAGYGKFLAPSKADKEAEARRESAVEKAAALKADYPNDSVFKNAVLSKLNPGQLGQLEGEVAKLRRPENASRLEELKRRLSESGMKDIRKRLRGKSWFPQEWLPPQ